MADTPIEGEGLHPLLFRFLKEAIGEGEHESQLFQLLHECAEGDPYFPLHLHLKNALYLLENVERSFIERRSCEFFTFLFDRLSSKEPSNDKKWPNCHIFPFLHSVSFPFQTKKVLGLLIELQGIHSQISSIEQSLLSVNQEILLIQNSSFCLLSYKKDTTRLYFEIQKKKGAFSQQEIEKIKKQAYELSLEITTLRTFESPFLESHELSTKIFRWIMNDIRKGDLPYVFIDLHRQTEQTLRFFVLVCRIKEEETSLEKQLDQPEIHIEWQMAKTKESIDHEGAMLKVDIPLTTPLSLTKGRNRVAQLIKKLIGPFRDVNGGLLEKEEESFKELKAEASVPNEFLRDFFLSIAPEEKWTTIPISLLKALYLELDKQKMSDLDMKYTVNKSQDWISITAKMR